MKCQKFTGGVRNLVLQGVYKGQRIRKELGIPLNAKVILSVGEVNKNKNHKVGIEALAKLRDKNTYYVICGRGPLMEAHKELAQSLGVGDRVILTGYRTDVADFYKMADVFLFPSFREGLPVAVMEAMAVGLPVIATRIRGITDLLEHTKGGYLADDWEPENYAVKVRRMFSERGGKSGVSREERRREMGTWNRRKVQEFALPVVDKKMREIYGSVMEEFDENITDTHVNL